MEYKRKILIHGLVLAVIVMLSPMTTASSPPCMVYGYTSAQNEPHYSMIKNESYVFGNELTIKLKGLKFAELGSETTLQSAFNVFSILTYMVCMLVLLFA